MSTKSSLAAQLGPQVRTRAVALVNSDTDARLILRPLEGFVETVPFVRSLVRRGVKASVARAVADRLLSGHPSHVEVSRYDGETLLSELRALKVGAKTPLPASGRKLARARKNLNLSQEQFANLVGLEVRTLQNWEQKRDEIFDGPIALLIKILEQHPEIAQKVAADDPSPGDDQARPAA